MSSSGAFPDQDEEVPRLPSDVFQLGSGARRVTDADEEVFVLYTSNAAPIGRTGLGSVDSSHDLLSMQFDLENDEFPQVKSSTSWDVAPANQAIKKRSKTRLPSSNARSKARTSATSSTTVEVTVQQDSTSLRSTDGDTGSVVWRSSLRLGACMIRQLHRRPYGQPPLLNKAALGGITVLELGSGTGVLPALLLPYLFGSSPTIAPMTWIATDQDKMLNLLHKNVTRVREASSMNVLSRGLDWTVVTDLKGSQTTYGGGMNGYKVQVLDNEEGDNDPDVIIAVDCVFNPSLFEPLVDTFDLFTRPGHTVLLVVIELRSSDATLAFLETWLRKDSNWEIWAIPTEQLSCQLDKGYAAWLAWKKTADATS